MDAAEKNRKACREYYARNRKKLLAQLKEKRRVHGEAMRERARANYAKHREKRQEAARNYRRENAEAVNAKAKEKYWENRDEINARRYILNKSPRRKAVFQEYIRKWREQNPDKEIRYHAKRLLSEATGVAIRLIPDELAEAKVGQIMVVRAIREAPGVNP